MFIEVVKNSAVKCICRYISRERVLFRKNNFALSTKYYLIVNENNYNPQYWQIREVTSRFSNNNISRCFNSTETSVGELDKVTFENICGETLDSLTEYFEELIETLPKFKNADVTYSDGVLTVHLGNNFGTYVINRQSPNLQIWLSSPKSGPKRYDFMNGTWVYKHDKTTLHSLLEKEIKEIANQEVQFIKNCLYAKASI